MEEILSKRLESAVILPGGSSQAGVVSQTPEARQADSATPISLYPSSHEYVAVDLKVVEVKVTLPKCIEAGVRQFTTMTRKEHKSYMTRYREICTGVKSVYFINLFNRNNGE